MFDQRHAGMEDIPMGSIEVFQALSNPSQQKWSTLGMLSLNIDSHARAPCQGNKFSAIPEDRSSMHEA
jgi:hypothetical protein